MIKLYCSTYKGYMSRKWVGSGELFIFACKDMVLKTFTFKQNINSYQWIRQMDLYDATIGCTSNHFHSKVLNRSLFLLFQCRKSWALTIQEFNLFCPGWFKKQSTDISWNPGYSQWNLFFLFSYLKALTENELVWPSMEN